MPLSPCCPGSDSMRVTGHTHGIKYFFRIARCPLLLALSVVAAYSSSRQSVSPLCGEGVGMQNYTEKGLIFSHLRNHHCGQGKANSTPAEMGGVVREQGIQNLLPQGEAFQPHRGSFCSRDHFWELHFYFGLIFTHHSCE